MDEALVQNAQHDVHHQYRDQQQDAEALQGILKCLGGALQAGVERHRQIQFGFERLDPIHRRAERNAGQQVEGNRHRRQLALMVHSQRLGLARHRDHGIQRHQRPIAGTHVKPRQRRRIGLKFGGQFQNDLVLVGRAINGGHLTGAEGILQCVLDLAEI